MSDLVAQLAALRQQAERTGQLRARAETTLEHTKRQLGEIDAQLKALGVDPDTAEVQLELMKETLRVKMQELSTTLTAEEQACNAVLLAASQATQ